MRGLESDQLLNIALLTTGGTIDKTYDPLRGVLRNDVSVLDVGDGFAEVIATSGDSQLGGDDFDAVIVKWLIEQFMQHPDAKNPKDDPSGYFRRLPISRRLSPKAGLVH